jgi:hypothetical protein
MCTVSWTATRGDYELFFNRDELKTRAAEVPPAPAKREGVAYIAPRDGERGGTWIAANEFGLTVCLLNDYTAASRAVVGPPRFSRGHVVMNCAASANHAQVLAVVCDQPLHRTSPFHLLALNAEEGALVLHWNGTELVWRQRAESVPPLTSSSFATDEVVALRESRFGAFVRSPRSPEAAELAAYHRQHARAAGAHSVLMHRSDAATRSITHVKVTAQHVRMSYEAVQWTTPGPVMLASTSVRLTRCGRATLAA